MTLLVHIILATISTLYALYTAFSPSKNKFRITYLLTFGTIVTGAIMTIFSPQLLGQVCVTGILYLTFIIAISWIAQKRFVAGRLI